MEVLIIYDGKDGFLLKMD